MDLDTLLNKFLDLLNQEQEFIISPLDYIYEAIPDANSQVIIECLRYINMYNNDFIEEEKRSIAISNNLINQAKPIVYAEPLPEETIDESEKEYLSLANYSTYLDLLLYSDLDSDLEQKFTNLTHNDIKIIKLLLLKKRIAVEKELRTKILSSSLTNLTSYQAEITKINNIFTFLSNLEKKEEYVEEESTELSNIILIPHNKTSYLYEDISKYLNNRKEIKITIDKLLAGYFLKTRDTKSIEIIEDVKLYEYRHPNGIRILYIVEDNFIYICSLFYKDKQRSIKIDNYYKEAVRRYKATSKSIQDNLTNPEFYIEQEELIEQINSLLEPNKSLKKVGDNNV